MDIATGAIGSILSKLTDLLKSEYVRQTGVKERIEDLTKELESAQAFLQDIDKVPPDQVSNVAEVWAREVRETSYDMEDILDSFLVRVEGPADPINKKRKLSFPELFEQLQEKVGGFFGKTVARHDIARAIDDVKKRLQEATERRERYAVDGFVTRPSPQSVVDPRLEAMYKDVTQLIGIEKSRGELASLLSLSSQGNEMSNKKLKIVSVVGVGGLGKTTLAKAVYDKFKAQFTCCAFVAVGRNPDLKKVFRDILLELDKGEYRNNSNYITTLNERQLINELQDLLREKRYFIVIDDMWDTESWKTINLALVQNTGSRIIITTRNSEVAIEIIVITTSDPEVATGEVYKLQPLSNDDSKQLLYARIFGSGDKCGDNQRQKVSEATVQILKKCGGVPLAVITMASYLVGKSMEQWLEVCNSNGFCGKVTEQTNNTEWILSLSYHDLPPHLKTCLLYLSVFPEDYLIIKDELIWMWIGEGFVNSGKPEIGLFEIGEGYFNDLINRSLIQPVEKEKSKIIKGCRVHDMILDLIRSLSRKTNFAIVPENGEDMRKARRLAFQNGIAYRDAETDMERARSLIAFGCTFGSWVPLQRIKRLRVLHLKNCCIEDFDEHVGNSLHWRFIGMCGTLGTGVHHLTEIRFMFLRVLYLEHMGCRGGLLPSSMSMLTQLVCLRAPTMILPGGTIKDLTSLQELQIYHPNRDDNNEEQFVKYLANLHELRVLRTDIDWMDDSMRLQFLKSVGNLHKLQRLQLDCAGKIKPPTCEKGLALLPRGLCQLDIRIVGPVLPPCIDPSLLPMLSHLTLDMYSFDDKGLKILGGLPELLYLKLYIIWNHRATLTDTAAHGCFPKLRSCVLLNSTVHFVVNNEAWRVSFYSHPDPHAFDSIKEKDNCRVAQAVMPNLEALYFNVDAGALTTCKNGSCDNLGLQYLAFLQKVTVKLHRGSVQVGDDVVEKEKAALWDIIRVHPNRPTLQIK